MITINRLSQMRGDVILDARPFELRGFWWLTVVCWFWKDKMPDIDPMLTIRVQYLKAAL